MNDSQSKLSRERALLGLFLLLYFLLALNAHEFCLPVGAHWSGDSAIKDLQAEILRDSHFRKIAVPYPSSSWDPQGQFFPFASPFVTKIQDRYYFAYPIVFPLVLALLRSLLGIWAAGALVASGSVLLLYFTHRLARRVLPDQAFPAILVLAFATPVWLYSTLLWAHTAAAAVFMMGFLSLLAARSSGRFREWILAGLCFGAGTWLRTEGAGLTLAVLAATLLWSDGPGRVRVKRAGWILLGFCLALSPLALLNWCIYGSLWGPHAGGVLSKGAYLARRGLDAYLGPRHLKWYRLSIADWLLVRSTNYGGFSAKTAIPFALFVLTVLTPCLRQSRRWILFNLGFILLVLVRVLYEVFSAQGRTVSGLLIVMPYSILAFWYLPALGRRGSKEDPEVRYLFGIVVAFLLVSIVLNLGNKGGLQWGPRYLMPVFGLLVVLAMRAIRQAEGFRRLAARILIGALVAVAFLLQLVGFWFVRQDEADIASVLDYLRQQRAVAVVGYDRPWLVQMCAPLYQEKRLYLVRSPEALQAFWETSKPFSNASIIVISRDRPLNDLVNDTGDGVCVEMAPRFWAWSPRTP